MAGALAAIGLASNVMQLIDFGGRLCSRIKEISSSSTDCPGKLKKLERHLRQVVSTLKGLNNAGREVLEHEQDTLESCLTHAKELYALLRSLQLDTATNGSRLKSFHPKTVYVALRSMCEEKKIEEFQQSLDQLIGLVDVQLQIRNKRALDRNTALLDEVHARICASDKKTEEETTKHFASLPYDRNNGFVGREKVITRLEGAFKSGCPGQRRVVLHGLGGVGKSQIASEYAFRLLDMSPEVSVFWVHAETKARFEENYKRIAFEGNIAGRNDPNLDLKQLVRDWLEKRYNRDWLFIVDNVDDKETLFSTDPLTGKSLLDYVPRSSKGTILFTTRNRDIAMDIAGDISQVIKVEPMGISEAVGLLVKKIGQNFDMAHAEELFKELEYLPLAIAQAAAYMQKRHQTVSEYLQQYSHSDASKVNLLNHSFVAHGRESRILESVITTWLISFQHIQSENPQAADLLSLMSFFDRQGIPRSLLPAEDYDPVEFNEAIGILEAFSLIESMHNHRSYDIHRLVQLATRTWIASLHDRTSLPSTMRNLLQSTRIFMHLMIPTWMKGFDNGKGENGACRALLLLASRFPEPSLETAELCAKYLPHAEKVLQYRCEHMSVAHQLARQTLASNVSCYLWLIGVNRADVAKKEYLLVSPHLRMKFDAAAIAFALGIILILFFFI